MDIQTTPSGSPALRLACLAALMALALPAAAELDTHSTGMSDIWQRTFHAGQLFDPANPAHAPEADPDGDGWTNRMEATAGTDPFKASPPDGIVQCTLSGPANARILTWPVVPGKQYTVHYSATLGAASWQAIAPAIHARAGQAHASTPVPAEFLTPSAFFRVEVQDTDTDLDGLTDYEELRYGTDPANRWSIPGIGDFWLASHFANPADCVPAASPHGDGYNHSYYYQFNLDPQSPVGQQPGRDSALANTPAGIGMETFLNGDFTSPAIGTGERADKARPKWDYWTEVPDWTAVNGTNIEFQNHGDISGGIPYCELEAEPMSHTGIKQTIGVVPGKTYLITLDYSARVPFQRPSGVHVAVDNVEKPLIDIATVDGWTKKLATFTAASDQDTVEIKITPPAGGTGFVKAIRLIPVEVKEVWSDQITGVEANGFPDKTGPNEYPYIFMGSTSATTFKVKINLAAEIPATVRSQILFRWASEGIFGEFLPEIGISTFSDGTTVQLDSNFNIGLGRERYLIMAFDENKNGQIDFSESETLIKMPHISRGVSTSIPCKFIPIAQADYEDSKETLLAWASSPLVKNTLRNSGWHLTAFCNGAVPAYAGSEPTTIKRNEPGLSHPVGVAFTPTNNPGVSFKATISKDHDLSIKLIESNALRSWLAGEFNSFAEGIRADIIEARRNGYPAQLLSYSIEAKEKSLAFGIIDPDLLFCLGKVTFENPTIEFDVGMFGYVSNVKISGIANDLYDFDREGEEFLGYPARKAAEVQAGFPSLGDGGKVFKTQIDLGGGNPYANPDLTPYTFFPY